MSKRIVMCFTKYGEKNKTKLIRFLESLEFNEEYNVELANVTIDPNGRDVVAEKYGVITTPTLILLKKEQNKDCYYELRRMTISKFNEKRILDFLKN